MNPTAASATPARISPPYDGAARALVQRLLEALAAPYRLSGGAVVYTSATVGVRFADGRHITLEELLRDADTAMYAAKANGRGGSKVFDAALRRAAVERAELDHGLRQALERDEIRAFFQPIINVADGSVTGAEALLRWSHSRLGLIGPDRFLDVAEETGLLVPIGEEVLRQACQEASAWQQRWGRPVTMAVNLSAAQLATANFAERVEAVLADTGLPAGQLHLELTAQVLMADTPAVRANHDRLRAVGVRFYVDDFGTGYSSLTYLHRFQPDGLKIDRSFLAGVPADRERTEITTAVLGLAQSLRITAVAEGVENEQQLRWLQDKGCESAQGYLFSPPIPAAEFEARYGPSGGVVTGPPLGARSGGR